MKILIIHPYFKTHYKAIIYSNLSNLIDLDRNYELKVLQLFLNESSRQNMETVDYNIHQYPYEILFKTSNESVSFFKKLTAIFKFIKSENPSIINITGYYDLAVVLPSIWFRLKGTPIVMSIDSTLNDNSGNSVSNFIKKWILGKMDGFFSYGKKSTELITRFGVAKQKVLVENNAVDNEKLNEVYITYKNSATFVEKSKSFPAQNFIFVGRFIPEKNLKELIRTFAKLETKNWGLILAGTGPLKEELMAEAAHLKNVFFEEPLPWYEVPHLLAHANVFVLPSTSEPWGLVVNEAMACGMPVIVSQACGSAHDLVIEGINGFIFDPNKNEELESNLMWCVKNDNKLRKMGKESLKLISTYTPSIVAKQMFDGFKTLTK
ncbi:Glycosyltransferase involved in cell wall bisynthesis [Spirosomataceae bacterium TFI 002]|nr:Glycosyltransferase involved in cell wall bisynthesis [Spirosomataceae bacterium TFI 002]